MRYKVPQDVQQADKIVGPLTAIQLVMCIVGATIGYFFFKNLALPFNILAALVVAAVTIAFVFVKVNEMTFAKYLQAMGLYLFRPRVRTWKKMSDVPMPSFKPVDEAKKKRDEDAASKAAALEKKRPSLSEIMQQLDANRRSATPKLGDEQLVAASMLGKRDALDAVKRVDEVLKKRQEEVAARKAASAADPTAA